MHLADGEIVEVEAQFRRGEAVRRLLVRQGDVERDRQGVHIGRAAIAGFHDAGTAAGDDDIFLAAMAVGRMLRGDGGEAAGLLVEFRIGFEVDALGLVAGRPGCGTGLGNAGAAEQHDGGQDARLVQRQFGFHQLELKPDAAGLLAGQEVVVGIGQRIGGRAGLRGIDLYCRLFLVPPRARKGIPAVLVAGCVCHRVCLVACMGRRLTASGPSTRVRADLVRVRSARIFPILQEFADDRAGSRRPRNHH